MNVLYCKVLVLVCTSITGVAQRQSRSAGRRTAGDLLLLAEAICRRRWLTSACRLSFSARNSASAFSGAVIGTERTEASELRDDGTSASELLASDLSDCDCDCDWESEVARGGSGASGGAATVVTVDVDVEERCDWHSASAAFALCRRSSYSSRIASASCERVQRVNRLHTLYSI